MLFKKLIVSASLLFSINTFANLDYWYCSALELEENNVYFSSVFENPHFDKEATLIKNAFIEYVANNQTNKSTFMGSCFSSQVKINTEKQLIVEKEWLQSTINANTIETKWPYL